MLFFLLLSMLVGQLSASPLVPRQSSSIWKDTHGTGNIEVYFSDTQVNWGWWEPSSWLDELNCDSAHCDDITGKTQVLRSNDAIPSEFNVKLSFEENYDPEMVKPMKDMLRAALYESASKWPKTYYIRTCGGMGFCSNTEKHIDQYWGPKSINVRHVDSDSNMKFELELSSPYENGLCEVLVKIGGGIAGGVNGAAGGMFSVGELFCDG